MNYSIEVSSYFSKEAKRLNKKYHSFASDLAEFRKSLIENPIQGDEIAPRVRKIRLAIKSKSKGKSGGARIITYNIIAKEEEDGKIFLLLIYDKEDASNFKTAVIKDILKEFDL